MNRKNPVLFNSKTDCCGCTACYSICPKHAIKMVYDDEGFAYPEINTSKCISCFLCEDVCPIKTMKILKGN